jgi:signal transduction histidine kinase
VFATPRSPRAERSELVSLSERMTSLGAVRAGCVLVVAGFCVATRHALEVSALAVTVASAAYLVLLGSPWLVARLPRVAAQRLVAATLLVDGVYLGWVVYATGGTQSPLRVVILVHVVAVTLLGSSRTGLKIAAWHSLLFFVAMFAQAGALVPIREADARALPGSGDFVAASIVQIGAVWVAAFVTAACSAVSERELRAQKVDLDELSAVVRDLDGGLDATQIPRVLLATMCRVFGFGRGVVLASPDGDLAVLASHGVESPGVVPTGLDGVVERAWAERRTQLVRALDPERDARLHALLPAARNVLVVPLLLDGSYRVGAIAVEHPGRSGHVKRWVVAVVEQFATHAALSLHNAWLRAQLERRLEEIGELQQLLVAQNLELEVKVRDRTRDLTASLDELAVANEQRRRLLERLVHAEEESRQRVAADLHDDPIQKMVAVSMRLQLLRRALAGTEHAEEVERSISVLRGTIGSMRHMIFELRPHALDERGLAPALRELLESFEAGFEFRIDDGLRMEPPEDVRVVLYRMAQEALGNVRKHADASRVLVRLSEEDGGFAVRITDDGVGFSPPEHLRSERGHLGLTSLRERAEMTGGWCRVHSLPGEGTTVEFWVPAVAGPSAAGRPRGAATVVPILPDRERTPA